MTVRRIPVPSSAGSYEVIIGEELLARAGVFVADALGSQTAPILLVYDERLEPFGYVQQVQDSLACVFPSVRLAAVPSGEKSKSLAEAQHLYRACIEAGLDRSAAVIALGGGVVGDLAGFVAATYMRGVHFVQMPTTLLAHDSSIGGKVAINLPEGKNLIGAFYPPRLVLYDVTTLESLPVAERANGLAEAVKHGVIRDSSLFAFIEDHADDLLAGQPDKTAQLLARSCQIKVDVATVDERESGLRAILNFGHTIGHAVEAFEEGRLAHGAAVAIGMVQEARLAASLSLTDSHTVARLETLLQRLQLPTALPLALANTSGVEALVELMRRDKKAVRRSLSFVLPNVIGDVTIHKDIAEAAVRAILLDGTR